MPQVTAKLKSFIMMILMNSNWFNNLKKLKKFLQKLIKKKFLTASKQRKRNKLKKSKKLFRRKLRSRFLQLLNKLEAKF